MMGRRGSGGCHAGAKQTLGRSIQYHTVLYAGDVLPQVCSSIRYYDFAGPLGHGTNSAERHSSSLSFLPCVVAERVLE